MKATIAYIGSVIDTTILASVVSTQLVLADVAGFGLTVTMSDRIHTTIGDLLGLGPTLLMLVGLTFAVAFPLAALGQRQPQAEAAHGGRPRRPDVQLHRLGRAHE